MPFCVVVVVAEGVVVVVAVVVVGGGVLVVIPAAAKSLLQRLPSQSQEWRAWGGDSPPTVLSSIVSLRHWKNAASENIEQLRTIHSLPLAACTGQGGRMGEATCAD